jgi:hypothetical protein
MRSNLAMVLPIHKKRAALDVLSLFPNKLQLTHQVLDSKILERTVFDSLWTIQK